MKHLKSVLFLMVALMLVLSACGGGTAATQAPAHPAAERLQPKHLPLPRPLAKRKSPPSFLPRSLIT